MDFPLPVVVSDHLAMISFRELSLEPTADFLLHSFSDAGIALDLICQTAFSNGNCGLAFACQEKDLLRAVKVVGGLRARYPELKATISNGNCKLRWQLPLGLEGTEETTELLILLMRAGVLPHLICASPEQLEILVENNQLPFVWELLRTENSESKTRSQR